MPNFFNSRHERHPHTNPGVMHGVHDHGEDRTELELRESAYRRGYEHGMHLVLEAIEAGIEESDLKGWRRQTMLWRYRMGRYARARSSIQHPPMPAVLTGAKASWRV